MIKIKYLQNGARQESGYPVLYFQLQGNHKEGFIHLKGVVENLCKNEGKFKFSSKSSIYELGSIQDVIFESKSGKKVLSSMDNNKITTSLDKKYWKYFLKLINIISQEGSSGHVYSDDRVMSDILKELEGPISMIFDRDPDFINLDIIN